MSKRCLENQCREEVVYACSCTTPESYLCTQHFMQHSRKPGKHIAEFLVVEASSNQIADILPRLKEIIRYLDNYRRTIVEDSKLFIDCIESAAKKALQNIQHLQENIAKLIFGQNISEDDYRRILSMEIESDQIQSGKINLMIDTIQNLFEFHESQIETWTECNEVIFSKTSDPGGLVSINLTNFTLSTLDFAPIIGQQSQACKMSQNLYFFYGGHLINGYKGESYLINIKEKTYESLPKGLNRGHGGSVLKDDKVYVFGGHTLGPTAECNLFSLKTKEWRSIPALPLACHQVTAALLNKTIILSGFQMNCCCAYDDLGFTDVLRLPAMCQKIVCEGWIAANSILYENKENNVLKWVAHNVDNPLSTPLRVFCIFKKGYFLYFIDYSNSLMRIDTRMKRIEKIGYN